jgi:sec-independent protein translocase protein TatB
MFDVGILELFIVGVIALLVLGPERLPKAAQQAGRWFAYAKRSMSHWTDEINRQIENDELAKELKNSTALKGLGKELEPINKAFSESLSGLALGGESMDTTVMPINAKKTTESGAMNDVPVAEKNTDELPVVEAKISASA